MTISKLISVHHIGGRAGTQVFPDLENFRNDIVNVLYDADADCIQQIKNTNDGKKSPTYVLQYCLSDRCKTNELNITYDPYGSSLFEFNPDYQSYYSYSSAHDNLFSENMSIQEKRTINTVNLDYIVSREKIPAPNFLSVDTQGAEYDILLGAKEMLKSHVVAIVLEAYIHPLYKGHKLFGDICRLLDSQGFHFIRFLYINEASSFRAPLGFRGQGLQVLSDALFFRKPDYVTSSKPEENYCLLKKLAFVAFIYNQSEYAIDCINRSKKFAPTGQRDEGLEYLKFLNEVEALYEKTDKLLPETFRHYFPSFELSKARFDSKEIQKYQTKSIKYLLKSKIPWLHRILKGVKGLLRSMSRAYSDFIKCHLTSYSPIEKLFLRYNLKKQADLLRKYRLDQSLSVTSKNGKLK